MSAEGLGLPLVCPVSGGPVGSCGRGTRRAPKVQSRLVGPKAPEELGRQDRETQRRRRAARSVTGAAAGTWMGVLGAWGVSW